PFPCRGYLRRLHGHGRLRPLPPTRICIGRCHAWHIGEYDIADVNVELTKNPTGRDGRNWHIASIRARTSNGRYRRHSGHCWILARVGSVANDPKRTKAGRATSWAQVKSSPSYSGAALNNSLKAFCRAPRPLRANFVVTGAKKRGRLSVAGPPTRARRFKGARGQFNQSAV